MNRKLLGGLTPRAFLARHWQKRPLFVRCAIASPALLDERALTALARRDDVESGIVQRRGSRRDTEHGPFAKIKASKINWSILVNGVNHHVAGADELLRRFSFVPQARLDDVMVSFATPGGGVGPHVDSYDVFLIQGAGRRRWTVTGPGKKSVYTAHPGDLLYLPPGWRHDGVALDACFTYSIGFRAPRGAELGAAFLDWLHERGLPDASYRDPRLAPASRPGRIPAQMLGFASPALGRIRWTSRDVAGFLGEDPRLPQAPLVFRGPPRPRRPRRLAGAMVHLDLKSQLLYSGRGFFINGEIVTVPEGDAAALRRLADERCASGDALVRARLAPLMSDWQRRGYVSVHRGK